MRIISIEVDGDDVTFWFNDSDQPWNAREFKGGADGQKSDLHMIEIAIHLFNQKDDDDEAA